MGGRSRSERGAVPAAFGLGAERSTSTRIAGKASSGGYGVQDHDPFVEVVKGSLSNVVGLPMERLAGLLQDYPRLMR